MSNSALPLDGRRGILFERIGHIVGKSGFGRAGEIAQWDSSGGTFGGSGVVELDIDGPRPPPRVPTTHAVAPPATTAATTAAVMVRPSASMLVPALLGFVRLACCGLRVGHEHAGSASGRLAVDREDVERPAARRETWSIGRHHGGAADPVKTATYWRPSGPV